MAESAAQLQARLNELQGVINTIVVNKIAFVAAADPNAEAAAQQQAQMAAQQQQGGPPPGQPPQQDPAAAQQQAAMEQQQQAMQAQQQQAMMQQQQAPQGQPPQPQQAPPQGNPVEQQLAELMQAVSTIADEFGKLQQQVMESAKAIEGFTKTSTELKVQFGAMEKVIVKLQNAIEEPPAPTPAPQMQMPKEPPAPNGPTIHLH